MDRLFVKLTQSLALVMLTACSSAMKHSDDPLLQPDQVISRSDDLTQRPAWLKETEPFRFENGSVKSLGMAEIPGGHRIEAGYRIAENNSKVAIASAIEQRLDYIFQQAQEDTAIDSSLSRMISGEATRLITSSLHLENRYWERVVTTTESGERIIRYRIFARIAMPEVEFKKAIQAAIRKQAGKGHLSADFESKVNAHWDQFTGQPSTPKVEVQPAAPEAE